MFLTTDRLQLRPGTAADAEELTTAIAHWSVARMLERLPWPYTVELARGWLALPKSVERPEPLIVETASGRIVGGVGLIEKDEVELGYWITPSAWGRGYATEAARAMVAHARNELGLSRIVSGHFAQNPASGRVLANAGFRPTGAAGMRPCLARREEVAFVEYEWAKSFLPGTGRGTMPSMVEGSRDVAGGSSTMNVELGMALPPAPPSALRTANSSTRRGMVHDYSAANISPSSSSGTSSSRPPGSKAASYSLSASWIRWRSSSFHG